MSFKSKLLNILTFGHLSRKAKKEAAKRAQQKNDQLTINTMDLPDVTALIDGFGGIQNITNITNTISTISFKVEDFTKVDLEQLKKIATRGVVKSSENITLIVGDCATALKAKIEEYKNK